MATVILLFGAVRASGVDPITVMWDPNPPEEGVLGYLVSVGTAPGVFTETYDVGAQTTFVYPNTVAAQEYFFAVVAYDILRSGPSSEVSGFSTPPPSLVNPGDQSNSLGQAVALQLDGSDIYGAPVSYSASGLPPGLTLSESTGLISGAGTSIGIYSVTVTVTDGVLSTPQSFFWFMFGGPPTVAITSPTTQATYSASGGTVTLGGTASDDLGLASVTWSNNRGGAGAATGTTSWSTSAVPLKVGENVITVTVRDQAGRTATATLSVASPGTPPPTVTITLPTSTPTYATSSPTIGLGGTASDGIGVTAVTWVNDRGGSGTAIIDEEQSFTSWFEPEMWLRPGANVVTVTAWNDSGNSRTAVLTVERANNPPLTLTPIVIAANKPYDGTPSATLASCTLSGVVGPGPIAAYSFDEGAGTTAMDSSGYGNHGALVNATWTAAGRRGGALSFNGIDAQVRIPDAPLLRLTTAMTLEAWVRSMATTATGWRDVVYKGDDNYYLSAASPNGRPAVGGTFGSTENVGAAFGPGALAANTWTHLAGTYDGAAVRLYVNGVEMSSVAQTGSLSTSAYPLEIGGDGDGQYFQYFEGIVDEVRIYNVALTPAQIQADLMIGADTVACAGAATFDSASVGEAKTVTVTDLALTGPAAVEFTLAATTATTTAAIEARPVTAVVTAADKRYDGTTSATLTSCTLSGVLGEGAIGCMGTATFDTAGAGTGKTVTVTNLALTGADAANYRLATTSATTTATIRANQPPVVTNPGAQGSFQGVSVTLAMTAMDPDGDPLTFAAANLPTGLTISPSTGVVSGTPTTSGAFAVVISASDASGTGQASFSWGVESPLPRPASPVSPAGSIATTTPAFSWTALGSVAYYQLSVSDASAGSPTRVWYTPAEAGCPLGGTCTVAAPKSLASGLVSWMVLTWNPFGYGPWSTTMSAVVDVADAAVPTPVPGAPSGPIATRTPTYRWSPISSAVWYQLSVTDALGIIREFWYSPGEACAPGPCAVTPNILLAIGSAQWKVRAWRTSGAGAWTAPVGFEATDSAPGTATLVSPLALVTASTPSFTWNAVLGTSYYLMRVTDRDNVTVERWYRPADAGCPLGAGVCTASPGIALKAGMASWKVLTWNGSGYGPWSVTREFLVEIADPAALTPAALSPTGAISSTNVTYRWTAMAGALSYRIAIRNNGGAPTYWWYSPVAAGCQAAAECSAVPSVILLKGTADWQVQAWTTLGYGTWSPPVALTVNIPAPQAPALVSPSGAAGSSLPPFRWNASANATLYYIQANDSSGLRVSAWLSPSQVGCASGGACTLNSGVTLGSGAGSWQVIAWNPTAYSPWSSTLAFIVP